MYSCWTTFYSTHFCCIFHQFMDQAITNKTWMVSWLCKRVGSVEGWLCKAVFWRLGQGRACKCKPGLTYIAVSQKGLTVWNIKISCPCSIQNVYLLCVMAPKECMMHNSQKFCLVVFKRIKRIRKISFQPWENFEIVAIAVPILFYSVSAEIFQRS